MEIFAASDGYTFGYRRFTPAGRCLGRVVCVHGIRSHSAWYIRTGQRLAELGFEAIFPDRRGAGANQDHRGDAPGPRRLIDDIAELIRKEQTDKPGLKTVLTGISWGGKVAAALPYRAPGLVQGLALISPGFIPLVSLPREVRRRIFLQRFTQPLKPIPIPLNEPELFTDNTQGQHFIREDPLGLTQASARFLFISRQLDIYLRRAKKKITMPVLLLLSGNDRVIDTTKTRQFVQRFPSPRVAVREFANAGHTFEFEAEDHPWFTDWATWLKSVCG